MALTTTPTTTTRLMPGFFRLAHGGTDRYLCAASCRWKPQARIRGSLSLHGICPDGTNTACVNFLVQCSTATAQAEVCSAVSAGMPRWLIRTGRKALGAPRQGHCMSGRASRLWGRGIQRGIHGIHLYAARHAGKGPIGEMYACACEAGESQHFSTGDRLPVRAPGVFRVPKGREVTEYSACARGGRAPGVLRVPKGRVFRVREAGRVRKGLVFETHPH